MKAIVYSRFGSPDVLELREIDQPRVGEGAVLVRVRAVSVNPADWYLMTGTPWVARAQMGLRGPKTGRLGVDLAGLTALQGLRDKGQVQPGQRVLINGAAGGVGTFAVQLASSLGADVTGVCSTRNVAMVGSLGADQVIDYTREDFTRSGRRYDLLLASPGAGRGRSASGSSTQGRPSCWSGRRRGTGCSAPSATSPGSAWPRCGPARVHGTAPSAGATLVRYSPAMHVEVEAVQQVSDELVDAAGRLLAQLSGSATPLGPGDLARIVSHDGVTLFVARAEGGVVGMLTLVTFPLPSGLRARIEDVVVDREARGHGVGTALTMAALDLARRQGARTIDLTSRPSRVAANRLYRQLGFQLRDSNVYRHRLP